MTRSLPDDPTADPLCDQVAAELRRRIISGEIAVGTRLRHGTIAEEFAVSPTPVREALRILAAQGVVTIEPHRGARVNGQSAQDIREIGLVRADLEGLAAALAVDRIDDRQASRMAGAWQDFSRIFDAGATKEELAAAWVGSNEEFHSVIVQASGNKWLDLVISELRRKLPHNISFSLYAGNTRLIKRNLDEHRAIATAVLEQDAESARRLMTEHITGSIEALARWTERTSQPS